MQGQLAVDSSMHGRMFPLKPSKSNLVAFGLKDPRIGFKLETPDPKVWECAVRDHDLGPTSGCCQHAWQGVPSYSF